MDNDFADDEEISPDEAAAAEVFSQLLDPAQMTPAAASVEGNEKAATDAYGWQKVRRKKERGDFFNLPITGFGPEGKHCLWLQAPKRMSRWQLVEGKAKLVQTPSCMEDEGLSKLRDEVLMSMRRTAPTMFAVVPAFLNYCAAVITSNYTCTDDDLNFLLTDGGPWQDGMARHLIASPDTIARVFDLRVAEPFTPYKAENPPAALTPAVPQPVPIAPRKKRPWPFGLFWR